MNGFVWRNLTRPGQPAQVGDEVELWPATLDPTPPPRRDPLILSTALPASTEETP